MNKKLTRIYTAVSGAVSKICDPPLDYRLMGGVFYQEGGDDKVNIKEMIDHFLSKDRNDPVPSKIEFFEGIKTGAKEHGDHEIFQYASEAIEKLRPVDARADFI